jgi:hypothetical protein
MAFENRSRADFRAPASGLPLTGGELKFVSAGSAEGRFSWPQK